MPIKLNRSKKRHLLLSLLYKLDKLMPFSNVAKMKLYLDLEWIFERFAHEKSFKVFAMGEHPVRSLSTSFLEKHLAKEHNVLDLGCNTGELTFLISKHAGHVTGIDNNAGFIDEAIKRYSSAGIDFVCDDAEKFLQKNDRRFDVLILSHILEHLDDPQSLLAEYQKFFDYIYVEVPDFERTHLNIYRQHLGSSLIYSDADHIWEFDRRDVLSLLSSSGLTVLDCEFRLGVQKYWCSTSSSK
ncbi:MAG TPA: class I SAM-dependent methyltransferase [Ohtaekwangia sp.]|nr:class I SAM-dependent methyltransferase [Ohtaekwangia sp.]